jgi:hypothetical protein
MWHNGEPEADSYRQWIRQAWQHIQPFSTGASYINFQTDDEDDSRIRDTYRHNLDRLIEIKKQYDPQNLFRVNRNISPALRTTDKPAAGQ